MKLTSEQQHLLDVNKTPIRWSLIPIELAEKLYPELLETDTVTKFMPLFMEALNAAAFYHRHELSLVSLCLKNTFELLCEEASEHFYSSSEKYVLEGTRTVAEVMTFGAAKYGVNSWRTLSVEDHLNHMIQHIFFHAAGDKTEPHVKHALCRCSFAIALLND